MSVQVLLRRGKAYGAWRLLGVAAVAKRIRLPHRRPVTSLGPCQGVVAQSSCSTLGFSESAGSPRSKLSVSLGSGLDLNCATY